MSSFNIWVTEKCNLCCTYCYETSKRTLSMSDETIGKTIAFIRKNFQINDYNMINFHGGEPLIAADIILRIVSECNSMGRFCYSLTTNGLLLNEDLAKKLIDSRIYISLSLDGTKEVHDLNRKKHDGTGTYDIVVNSLQLLKRKEVPVRIRMTVSPETSPYLFDSVMNAVKLGAKTIVVLPDLYDDNWNEQLLDNIKEQLIRIYTKLSNYRDVTFAFYSELKRIKKGSCKGGISEYNISADGKIYPCSYSVNDKDYIIGSVDSGIDDKLLDKHRKYYEKNNMTCDGCSNESACIASRCKFINKTLIGDYLSAPPIICKLERILNEVRVVIND